MLLTKNRNDMSECINNQIEWFQMLLLLYCLSTEATPAGQEATISHNYYLLISL